MAQRSAVGECSIALQLACAPPSIEECRHAVIAYLGKFGIDERALFRVEVVLEELVTNVIRHGQGVGALSVEAGVDDGSIRLVVQDDGAGFDPFAMPEPEAFTVLTDAKLGGLGISMVRKLAQRAAYERVDHGGSAWNSVTVEIARRRSDC